MRAVCFHGKQKKINGRVRHPTVFDRFGQIAKWEDVFIVPPSIVYTHLDQTDRFSWIPLNPP
ncbi:MAG: hypothetical protein RLZZ435_1823 [Cyanobacteriota bacterium]|jgi:uncharacterized protein (DUF2249 family)